MEGERRQHDGVSGSFSPSGFPEALRHCQPLTMVLPRLFLARRCCRVIEAAGRPPSRARSLALCHRHDVCLAGRDPSLLLAFYPTLASDRLPVMSSLSSMLDRVSSISDVPHPRAIAEAIILPACLFGPGTDRSISFTRRTTFGVSCFEHRRKSSGFRCVSPSLQLAESLCRACSPIDVARRLIASSSTRSLVPECPLGHWPVPRADR